jgi:hypothetical protein
MILDAHTAKRRADEVNELKYADVITGIQDAVRDAMHLGIYHVVVYTEDWPGQTYDAVTRILREHGYRILDLDEDDDFDFVLHWGTDGIRG